MGVEEKVGDEMCTTCTYRVYEAYKNEVREKGSGVFTIEREKVSQEMSMNSVTGTKNCEMDTRELNNR